MKKNIKVIIGIALGIIIGTSTIVGAATIFRSEDVTYSSPTNKTNVKDSLDELYGKVGKCPDGKWCYTQPLALADKVKLGDYISMTPTRTSYTISKDLTGYSEDQTINPSELNLWRVIRKNEDGTVDAISDRTSSTHIYFSGKVGYKNYIGALNIISSQYINDKHTSLAKPIGYFDKNDACPDSVISDCPTFTTFLDEIEEIKNVLGTMETTDVITNFPSYYWISGRYPYGSPESYIVNCIEIGGSWGSYVLATEDGKESAWERALRPIIVLKADLKITSGDGKSAGTAYIFE